MSISSFLSILSLSIDANSFLSSIISGFLFVISLLIIVCGFLFMMFPLIDTSGFLFFFISNTSLFIGSLLLSLLNISFSVSYCYLFFLFAMLFLLVITSQYC